MSDEDERSSDGKKTWTGAIEAFLCIKCRNLLRAPIVLVDSVGNLCSSCFKAIKGENCSGCGKSPSIIFPIAGSSSGEQILSDPLEVIFEPPAMNPPLEYARVHRNIGPVPSTSQQNIEPGSCPSNCRCYICKVESAELSPITERGTTSEEDRSEVASVLVECIAEVHRANEQDETPESVTSEEGTTSPELCKFEEVVDITNSVQAGTTEPIATVYCDERHEPRVTDIRLVPQDSSSSNETSERTETTTVETPEDHSQDQRDQQSEVLPVEANTERRNPEDEDVTDASRIVNAPVHSVSETEDPPYKKLEELEESVCEDNISKEMSTESLGIDVPEGPVRPSTPKSDDSESSVPRRRSNILKGVSEHSAAKPATEGRDETSFDVDSKTEDERRESQSSNIHEGKMTTIKKFGAEEGKLDSSDDESEEKDKKSHDHSQLREEKSASEQKKSESKKYDGEKSTTEKEKDESLADEELEKELEEGSSEEEESTDSEELKDEPDIPSNQKGEDFESKEGDGGSSADDLLGEEESEEESCDDKKSSKTKEDDVEGHREESITEDKGADREEVISTKERKSSMKRPEVKDSSGGEKSDDEDECKDQEASTSETEKYVEKEEPKDSKREYRPLEEEEDTSEGEESDDVEDSRKKGEKKEEESEHEPKNVESTEKEYKSTPEEATRYDRLTESESEDEESNDNIKKEIREEKEAEKITAKEEGGPSQDKSSGEKASECGTSKANGNAEDISKTSSQQGEQTAKEEKSTSETEDKNSEDAKCSSPKAGEKSQQDSSSTRDKEQISCKKSSERSQHLAEKEESFDITEARDTVLMIVERNPATMIKLRTLYGMENVALAQIMKGLRFQCQNYIHGCKESFSPEEMVAHKENCLFQIARCEFEDCIWTGTLKKYTRHFLRHTDLKKLQTVDDRFHLPSWNSQDSTYILQTSGGSFILRMKILESKLYYLIYDLRRTVGKAKFELFLEYYSKSGAKFKIRCNITRSAKLNYFDARKATAIDLNMLNSYIPLEDKPHMSIYVESDDPCFHMRTTFINLLKCKKCGVYMDSPIKQCMYGHYVCGSCYQNVEECPKCDASLMIVEALKKWKDDATYVCKFDLGKKVDMNLTSYHESSLCTFHQWMCPTCPEYKMKPFYDYFDLIEHMIAYHRVPVLPNSESIKKLSQLSYEIYFIQFSKLFLFKSVYSKETDTSEFYVIYMGPKQDRYRYEIQIKYKKGFYTKYMSLSCECAYNKSNEILRKEPQEVEKTTPVNAMSPAEEYISPDSSDKLSKEVEESTNGSTGQVPQKGLNEVAQSQTSATRRKSSLPQISSTQSSTVKSRYLTSQSKSNKEAQTSTSRRLSYPKTFSDAKMVKQNTNQMIAARNSQEIQRRSIGSTVQESPKPKPANTTGTRNSPSVTFTAIPKKILPKLSANIKSKCLAVKGKSETDEEKLTPDEGIVIQNGLERFGERFEFDLKITKITE